MALGLTLAELVIRITGNAAPLERELNRATGIVATGTGKMSLAFGGLKKELLGLVPAFSVVAVAGYTKHLIDAAGALQDLADRTGTTASFLSAMEAQAVETGASVEDVAQSINFMNNAIGEAAKGNEQAIDSFARLGISLDELKALSPEEQFYLISQRISELGTQFERTEAARNIFGRGVSALMPIIRQGGDAIRDMNKALEEQGHALSEEQIKVLDDFGDAMARTGHKIETAFTAAVANSLIAIRALFSEAGDLANNPNVSFERPASVTQATIGGPSARQAINEALVKRGMKPLPDEAPKQAEKATEAIKQTTKATDDLDESLKKVEKQSIQTTRILKDSFGDALESAMFDFENFGRAGSSILEGLARNLARTKIINPLSDAAGGLFDSLLPSFGGFFAEGGTLGPGQWGIAGENGPEIIRAGDMPLHVTPNHKLGGTTVVVQQTIQLSPGMPELINQRIREAAPVIAAQAQTAVFTAMQQGGAGSKIIGARN